jgi:hypothetical protein
MRCIGPCSRQFRTGSILDRIEVLTWMIQQAVNKSGRNHTVRGADQSYNGDAFQLLIMATVMVRLTNTGSRNNLYLLGTSLALSSISLPYPTWATRQTHRFDYSQQIGFPPSKDRYSPVLTNHGHNNNSV